MSETFVRRIDGAPGCGKTTYMFDDIEDRANNGCRIEDILVVTFTRSGRNDAIDELSDVYPSATREDLKDSVRTFHGAALVCCLNDGIIKDADSQLLIPDEESSADVYDEFCRSEYLDYEPESHPDRIDTDDSPGGFGDPIGNRIFNINEWLAFRRLDTDQHHRAGIGTHLDHETITGILDRWDAFKQNGTPVELDDDDGDDDDGDDSEFSVEPYFEHHDYIEAAIDNSLVPNANHLYADEFQDLCPQEYVLFRTWRESGSFDTITVAGDPEQSIYGFREATSYFFEEMPADETITLKTSYRNPSNITAVASAILDAHSETDPRGFSSHTDGGTVKQIHIRDDDGLTDTVSSITTEHRGPDDVELFLLCRSNRQVGAIMQAFERGGIPYQRLGSEYQTWNDQMSMLCYALDAIERRHPIPAPVLNSLVFQDEDSDGVLGEFFDNRRAFQGLSDDDLFVPEDYRPAFPDTIAEIIPRLGKLTAKQRAVLSATFDGTPAPHMPEDVRVGTIHSSKGLEARCVFLFENITKRTEQAYYSKNSQSIEEHRLFYVGATRASESLYIISDYAYGPVFPGFKAGIPHHTTVQ